MVNTWQRLVPSQGLKVPRCHSSNVLSPGTEIGPVACSRFKDSSASLQAALTVMMPCLSTRVVLAPTASALNPKLGVRLLEAPSSDQVSPSLQPYTPGPQGIYCEHTISAQSPSTCSHAVITLFTSSAPARNPEPHEPQTLHPKTLNPKP